MEEITGKNYRVAYDSDNEVVAFEGTLRLRQMVDYDSIEKLLKKAASEASSILTLDLRGLEYLNSSGITTLSMFVYNLSQQEDAKLAILALQK